MYSVTRYIAAAMLCLGTAAFQAIAGQITLTDAAGFPNGRTISGQTPAAAIDGNLNSFTFTTNPNTVAEIAYLAVAFDSTELNRIRLWKFSYGGGGNNSKNLVIQYTTGTGDLTERTYTTVGNLSSGFDGTELWHGQVNSNGTVGLDVHDSTSDGWGSLFFDQVIATGIRIGFSNPNPLYNYCDGITSDQTCNHYQVAEFQAWDSVSAAPEPSPVLLMIGGFGIIPTIRRLRRQR